MNQLQTLLGNIHALPAHGCRLVDKPEVLDLRLGYWWPRLRLLSFAFLGFFWMRLRDAAKGPFSQIKLRSRLLLHHLRLVLRVDPIHSQLRLDQLLFVLVKAGESHLGVLTASFLRHSCRGPSWI